MQCGAPPANQKNTLINQKTFQNYCLLLLSPHLKLSVKLSRLEVALEDILLLRGSLRTVVAEALVMVERGRPPSDTPRSPDGLNSFLCLPPLTHHPGMPPQNRPLDSVEQEKCFQQTGNESPREGSEQ